MGLVLPDPGLLIWMLISFGIVFFILRKYAWKAILDMLHERESSIDDALSSAKKAREEIKELKANNELIIVEAKSERDKLLKEANQVKNTIISEAKQKATEEADKIIEVARLNIQTEKDAAITEIKNKVADLSIQIAEKILKKEFADKNTQEKYIAELLEDIKLN